MNCCTTCYGYCSDIIRTHQRQEAGVVFLTRNTISPIEPSCCTENIVLQNQSLLHGLAVRQSQEAIMQVQQHSLGRVRALGQSALPFRPSRNGLPPKLSQRPGHLVVLREVRHGFAETKCCCPPTPAHAARGDNAYAIGNCRRRRPPRCLKLRRSLRTTHRLPMATRTGMATGRSSLLPGSYPPSAAAAHRITPW